MVIVWKQKVVWWDCECLPVVGTSIYKVKVHKIRLRTYWRGGIVRGYQNLAQLGALPVPRQRGVLSRSPSRAQVLKQYCQASSSQPLIISHLNKDHGALDMLAQAFQNIPFLRKS
jgi:hypothetical protein